MAIVVLLLWVTVRVRSSKSKSCSAALSRRTNGRRTEGHWAPAGTGRRRISKKKELRSRLAMDPTILIACSPPHSAQTAAVPGPGPPVMAASGHHGTRRGVAHVGMPWTAALNWARVPRAGEEPRGNGLSRARGWDGWISTAPPPLWHLDQGRGVVGLVMGTYHHHVVALLSRTGGSHFPVHSTCAWCPAFRLSRSGHPRAAQDDEGWC
jgi:hypothetical protein